MSDELEFDMPDEDVFGEIIISQIMGFHSAVSWYCRRMHGVGGAEPTDEMANTAKNAVSLATLGVLKMYDLGSLVICRDVSQHASGRAAERMIDQAKELAEKIMSEMPDTAPSGTLH